MIRKLLIVRKAKMKADLIDNSGLKPFIKGKHLPVSPRAWLEEAGLSHYGFVLELKLKDYQAVVKWCNSLPQSSYVTLLDMNEDPETSLKSVGLIVHPSAVEE
jgi:hypothetical protein